MPPLYAFTDTIIAGFDLFLFIHADGVDSHCTILEESGATPQSHLACPLAAAGELVDSCSTERTRS